MLFPPHTHTPDLLFWFISEVFQPKQIIVFEKTKPTTKTKQNTRTQSGKHISKRIFIKVLGRELARMRKGGTGSPLFEFQMQINLIVFSRLSQCSLQFFFFLQTGKMRSFLELVFISPC